MDDTAHLLTLQRTYVRKLNMLEQQIAQYDNGSVPTHLQFERESTQRELLLLEEKLNHPRVDPIVANAFSSADFYIALDRRLRYLEQGQIAARIEDDTKRTARQLEDDTKRAARQQWLDRAIKIIIGLLIGIFVLALSIGYLLFMRIV